MKKILIVSLSAIVITSITACATAPDPEVICTSEWIGKRSDQAIGKIEAKAGKSIKALTKAAQSWSEGKQPNLIQMFALRNSFKGLEQELKNGQGIKDLRLLSSTCNDPEIVSKAMGNLLRKQNLPESMINFIENFEPYMKLIAPHPVPQKTAQLSPVLLTP